MNPQRILAIASLCLFSACDKTPDAIPPDIDERSRSASSDHNGSDPHSPSTSSAPAQKPDPAKLALDELTSLQSIQHWNDETYQKFEIHLLELARLDPQAACHLLSRGINGDRTIGIDKVRAFSAMMQHHDPAVLIPLFQALVQSAATNPEGKSTAQSLLTAIATEPDHTTYSSILRILFEGNQAGLYVAGFFNEAAKHTGSALIDQLDHYPLPHAWKEEARLAVAYSISGSEPDTSLKLLDSMQGEFMGSAYGRVLIQMLEKDPTRTLEILSTFDASKTKSALRDPDFLTALAQPANRHLMNAALERLPFTQSNAPLFHDLAQSLFTADLPAAITMLDELPESPLRSQLIQDMWKNAPIHTTDQALQMAALLPDSSKEQAASGIAIQLATHDQSAALDFIAQNPPAQQSRLTADVVAEVFQQSLSTQSQAQAREIYLNEIRTGRIKPEDAGKLASQITFATTNFDLAAGIDWVKQQPPAYLPGAVQGLIKSWSTSDPVAASRWLSDLPPGPAREAGARALVREIQSTDPQTAAMWKKTYQK